jgi:hypothetical protein
MRKISASVLCVLLLSLLAVGALAAGKSKYFKYEGKKDFFSVEVPPAFKSFKFAPDSIDTKLGKKSLNSYSSIDNVMGFNVVATDFGVDVSSAEDINVLLGMARDAMAKQGKVIKQGKAKLDGNPALTLRDSIVAGGNTIFRDISLTYIKGRQYQVSFLAMDKTKLDSAEAKHFFSSFKYTGKK